MGPEKSLWCCYFLFLLVEQITFPGHTSLLNPQGPSDSNVHFKFEAL